MHLKIICAPYPTCQSSVKLSITKGLFPEVFDSWFNKDLSTYTDAYFFIGNENNLKYSYQVVSS